MSDLLASLKMSPDRLAERRSYIGASDLPIIMGGDEEKILKLWEFKRGAEAEDLSDILAVQMGSFTEPLNAAWLEKMAGIRCVATQVKVGDGLIRCTLDGVTDDAAVEFKHVGGRESPETVLDRYAPQLTGQMIASGWRKNHLSVLEGNSSWFMATYEWDDDYAEIVQSSARDFWSHVQDGTPPVALPEVKPPRPAGWKEVDMSKSNIWAMNAPQWLDLSTKVEKFKSVVADLKSAIPEDVKTATGHGIKASIAKNGAVRFTALGDIA